MVLLPFLGLALSLAACTTAPAPQAPVRSAQAALPEQAAVGADPAPFALIFGRHPATGTGGGALPTAETAVVQAMTVMDQAGGSGLDPRAAATMRRLLVTRSPRDATQVQDVSHALDLVEASLEAGPGRTQQGSSWYRNVSQIVTGLRFDLAVVDRSLARLGNPEMPDQERLRATRELQARLQALMLGRDLDGDGRVDPRKDVAGLLQLRDALGYAAVVDGEDWNCQAQPEPIQTVLASYRQEVLWCEMPRVAEEIPQS
ncbi:hypothetical protein [Geminicoccus roseus]|uniref:hypothetical protein n=1 Tax=Geminicoccus roseus TaxID=404900 RepID=UPI001969A4CD|nr:hypothetical protein [Geminicoccus roseus]